MKEVYKLLLGEGYQYIKDCDLSKVTWIHRGGVVDLFVEPLSTDALVAICRVCYANHLSFMVVGHTSNLYFLKEQCPSIIISTRKLSSWIIKEDGIHCQPGVVVKKLASYCTTQGISGFEGFVDLPGSVAGATVNNSSCFGSAISSLLQSCTVLKEDGEIVELSNQDLQYSKRNSILKNKQLNAVVIEVVLKITYGLVDELIAKAKANHQKRIDTQEGPVQNLGSTFAETTISKSAGFIVRRIDQVATFFNVSHPFRFRKRWLLALYGYLDLDRYISDKNLNCFVWKDENADKKFKRYLRFINRITSLRRLEIEIIGQ